MNALQPILSWLAVGVMGVACLVALAHFVAGQSASAIRTVAIGGIWCGILWLSASLSNASGDISSAPPPSEAPTSPEDPTATTAITSAPSSAPTPATPTPPESQPHHEPIDWTWAAYLAVGLALLVAAIALIATTWWALSRRHSQIRQRRARRHNQIDRWNRGLATLNATSAALAEFEFDREEVCFNRPLLGVLDEPATAEFYDAYATALDLRTDTIPLDDNAIATFVAAATKARNAFTRADENARRKARKGITVNNQHLTGNQRRNVDRARILMAQAADPSATPEFARNAQTKALDLLDEADMHIPERLIAHITRSVEAAHRAALTTGTTGKKHP